jgi:pilus assembly protein Flp/PilA
MRTRIQTQMVQLWQDDRGQDLVEYALLAGFAAVAASALFPNFAFGPIRTIFSSLSGHITRVTGF